MKDKRRLVKGTWYAALVIIFAGALWVPFYNSIEPRFAGIPFFYWFQFVWVIVTAAATALAYRAGL
ncbi:MAG TPA: DUF3311 domain-containing protein [Gammaproteobacteria bacterium]|nr:DUF3311 domain-containing protein [Gammaproteobacteria bacterium]